MKKGSVTAEGEKDLVAESRSHFERAAERFRSAGLKGGAQQNGRNSSPGSNGDARHVPSCPAAMLARIDVARRSIEADKDRAKKQGREYQPMFGPIGFTELAIVIFERLACNANMEDAWRALVKVFDDAKRRPDSWEFADFCYQNIGTWEFSPRRSPAEHKQYFEQIADDVMSLAARVVSEPEFGTIGTLAARVSPLEMVADDDLKWLLEQVDASPTDGIYIKSEEEAISYLRFCLGDIIPDLYRYSEWIASDARRIALQPSISDRPNGGSAQRIFFTKHLSKWFRSKFNEPMHEVVAMVASALFDEAVTADTVRKAAQGEPDVSIPFRRGKLPLPK